MMRFLGCAAIVLVSMTFFGDVISAETMGSGRKRVDLSFNFGVKQIVVEYEFNLRGINLEYSFEVSGDIRPDSKEETWNLGDGGCKNLLPTASSPLSGNELIRINYRIGACTSGPFIRNGQKVVNVESSFYWSAPSLGIGEQNNPLISSHYFPVK